MEIESQLTTIRYYLEESRHCRGVFYSRLPLNYLTCKVSHQCLKLISDEYELMRGLSDEVYECCGFMLRTSHQIYCACEIRTTVDSRNPISVDSIHVFRKTPVIRYIDTTDSVGYYEGSEDQ